jgi:hypothetical protein
MFWTLAIVCLYDINYFKFLKLWSTSTHAAIRNFVVFFLQAIYDCQ